MLSSLSLNRVIWSGRRSFGAIPQATLPSSSQELISFEYEHSAHKSVLYLFPPDLRFSFKNFSFFFLFFLSLKLFFILQSGFCLFSSNSLFVDFGCVPDGFFLFFLRVLSSV